MLAFSACPKMECCIAFRQSLIILEIKSPFQWAFYTKPLSNNRQFHPSACSEKNRNQLRSALGIDSIHTRLRRPPNELERGIRHASRKAKAEEKTCGSGL